MDPVFEDAGLLNWLRRCFMAPTFERDSISSSTEENPCFFAMRDGVRAQRKAGMRRRVRVMVGCHPVTALR